MRRQAQGTIRVSDPEPGMSVDNTDRACHKQQHQTQHRNWQFPLPLAMSGLAQGAHRANIPQNL